MPRSPAPPSPAAPRRAPCRHAPRAAALAAAALIGLSAAPPRAAAAPAAARGARSEARLVGAGAAADGVPGGDLLAGVEIRLDPHFITYWRDPGEAGVPPSFSFSGSANLRSATVRYPAPARFDEAGSEAFGYEREVVFPILVAPEDPSKPVVLAVTVDYATCHDICLPAHAELRLTVGRDPTPDTAAVEAALASVPRRSSVGATGPGPEILAVSPPDAAGGFAVRTSLPDGGAGGTLFVEAPEGWAYAAGAGAPDGPGRAVFPVKRLDAPAGERVPAAPLTLTLVSPAGAVEAPAALDAAGAKP